MEDKMDFEIDMMNLDDEDKRMIALMAKAHNEDGSMNWKLLEKLIIEDSPNRKKVG